MLTAMLNTGQAPLPVLAICLALIATMGFFAIWCALRGRPRTAYVEQRPPSILAKWFQVWWIWLWSPLERACVALAVPPNAISIVSAALVLVAAWCMGQGALAAGGWLFLFGASLDILDGRVARATGRSSLAGAFLDSTLDRVAELGIFAGLAVAFRDSPILYSTLAAAAFSVLVSYARARGESLGIKDESKVGVMQRAERVLVTGGACALSPIADWLAGPGAGRTLVGAALTALAVLSAVTALRRGLAIFHALQAREPSRLQAPAIRVLKPERRRDVLR